jgi:2-methylcitrate dehydratase PrpD|tara:strand:- start:2175 stop:3515 length:1341 start_codon:yes stop_codon:yes gene_type:complete
MNTTQRLAEYVTQRQFETLSPETIAVSKHCLLDFLGVTIAACDEPLVRIVKDQVDEEGGHAQATLIAGGKKVSVSQAALINGSASHAHDYDDVHPAMSGHPTVPVAPAVLALAEMENINGRDLILSLVTGIDAECIVGRYVGSSHYARGFHATATLGSLGAAAGCAKLLGLGVEQTRNAIGIAATQAAGLKSMFGSMCKPFHAGKAASNGLLAAQLASRGFDSQSSVLEVEQGFGLTHSDQLSDSNLSAAIEHGSFVPTTLFKYHAACYLTHSALEAAKALRNELAIEPDDIDKVDIKVNEGHFSVCNIQKPSSGLEAKFSLRMATAMVLSGIDTADIRQFNDDVVQQPAMVDLRDRITVKAFPEAGHAESIVTILLKSGAKHSKEWNVAIPASDLVLQEDKLTAKFRSLVDPVLGTQSAERIASLIASLDELNSVEDLCEAVRGC